MFEKVKEILKMIFKYLKWESNFSCLISLIFMSQKTHKHDSKF